MIASLRGIERCKFPLHQRYSICDVLFLDIAEVTQCRRLTPSPLILSRSLDDSVRSRENIRRDRDADLLGGLKIDHQLEFCRLLYRQLGRVGAF